MRIADSMLSSTVRRNLNANLERLARVQNEIATGKRLTVPSDDPAATTSVLHQRTERVTLAQYGRTVDAASARLGATDAALGSLTQVIQRARELTVAAGNAAIDTGSRAAMATEVNQLLNRAVQLGNSRFGEQYLFGGTRSTTPPFSVASDTPTAVTFNGNTTPVVFDAGANIQLRVEVPGDATFQSTVNALIQIRDALSVGDGAAATAVGLPALDSALNGLLTTRGGVGARVNTMQTMTTRMDAEQTALAERQSSLEDADISDAIIRLNSAQNTYQAALGRRPT